MTTHTLPERFRNHAFNVVVVGAGGNGSMLLPHLARIHQSLAALGRANAFQVTVVDHDTVEESNLGRQAYSRADLGLHKADIAVQRINLFFGLNWLSATCRYDGNTFANGMLITCVDNLALRKELAKRNWSNAYWLDLGNANKTGQIVLGGCGLPTLFDRFPFLIDAPEDTTTPSCSVAESLARQDLFINSTLANFAGQMLWTLLRTGSLNHHGYFVNLEQGRVAPIPIPSPPNAQPAPSAITTQATAQAPRLPARRPDAVGVRRPRRRARQGAVR
jgi:PRTRC genetic system ThiF family protein